MVRLFRKSGSKNYYFQIMVNGRRISESTRTSIFKEAEKRAEERCMELKLGLDYYFYIKKLVGIIGELDPKEKDIAISTAITELNSIVVKKVTIHDAFDLFRKKPRKRSISFRVYGDYQSLWNKFCEYLNENFPSVKYLSEITLDMAEKYLY